jgi:hypothetical protein
MGISLNGLTPAGTYVSLLKFGDNNAVTTSLKALSDGAGNDLPLQLSTTSVLLNGLQSLRGTTASDIGTLGSELLTTGTGDASWTGTNFATGYTHVAGSTTTLTSTVAAVSGDNYVLFVTMTLRTAGSISISFGGVTYSSITGDIPNVGFTASSTASLVITPTSDFNGKIVVSIKPLTEVVPITTWQNSSGSAVSELRSNTYGVGLGINALWNSTGGTTNVAIGNYSMQGNLTGLANTAVGHGSLQTSGGFKNVAIGRFALGANLSGEYSTAVGADALGNNRNGTGNTAIGQNALNANTSGSQNIALGTYAGSQYSNSNSNIIIGYNAQAGANDTTNQIIMGLTTQGLGSNKTVIGNNSTTQTYLAGNLTLGTTTDAGAKLYVKGSGTTSATTTFLVQNSAGTTGFQVADNSLIGIGNTPDTATLPARMKINPSNSKIANIGYFAGGTVPATLNDGDWYLYGGNMWLHSGFSTTATKGVLSARMKMTGLQSDFMYSSTTAKDFNQFNSSNWATYGWANLVHTGYSYGNTVLSYQPTSVGVDSRMYDGWLQSVNGNQSYDPCAQLYVDMKGSIFARGVGSGAETDWKKALTDNTNKTTTLGSETNYASAKFAVDSTTKGFLPPRMTTTEKNAISTPAAGLVVYDTTTNKLCCYNGSTWNDLF